MPTAVEILIAAVILALLSAAAALSSRLLAWVVLGVTIPLSLLADGGYHEAMLDPGMRKAVWHELGWSYVLPSILGPLIPSASVIAVLLLKRRRKRGFGFPIEPITR